MHLLPKPHMSPVRAGLATSTPHCGIELSTLIALSPMLGHALDDRTAVASGQDGRLVERFLNVSATPLPPTVPMQDFFVAPLDILPFRDGGERRYQLLELNGSGIGGLTNLPHWLANSIFAGFGALADVVSGPAPLIVVASSGSEDPANPRGSHLIHEKIVVADRIASSVRRRFGSVRVMTLDALLANPSPDEPVIVLGYTRLLVEAASVVDGRPMLAGRPISAMVNDRFIANLEAAHGSLDTATFIAANRCFRAGADKSAASALANHHAGRAPHPLMAHPILLDLASDTDNLHEIVIRRLTAGERLVIKPSGTGHGDGIEFFLDGVRHGHGGTEVVAELIAASLATVRRRYGDAAGFPYAVTPYLDANRVDAPGHALHDHKYELRIVVLCLGGVLHGLPAVAKVAPEAWDPSQPTRGALINNVSAAVRATGRGGAATTLPLCNTETLRMLGVPREELEQVCRWATGYVAHVLSEGRGAGAECAA